MENHILFTAPELAGELGNPYRVVVDCRFDLRDPDAGRRQYEEGHIPGAVYLDLDQDLAGPVGPGTGRHPLPDVAKIATTLGELGIGNEHRIVVYDNSHGALAARAWWVLRWLGHDAVFLLDGGFTNWQRLGLPVEAGHVERDTGTFVANPRAELVLTTRELASDPARIVDYQLLDARDGSRFRGEHEPLDPVAGHIPGTRNLPFAEFVRPDGTWLPGIQRAQILEKVLGKDRSVSWSVMCGSGVTACHLVISALEAGFSEPRVYVGSWSEWIQDPERPIVRGDP